MSGAVKTTEKLLSDKVFEGRIDKVIASYPKAESALIPCLHLCREEIGFIPDEVQGFIADKVAMSPAHVRGVVTFYEMFNEEPQGKYLLQVCKTLPCMLSGSESLLEHLQNKLGLRPGGTTQDVRFTLVAVECLACCDQGPAFMVNDKLYLRVSHRKADKILAGLE